MLLNILVQIIKSHIVTHSMCAINGGNNNNITWNHVMQVEGTNPLSLIYTTMLSDSISSSTNKVILLSIESDKTIQVHWLKISETSVSVKV